MNRYNPDIHHRRSTRLKGYDYSQEGAYFVTICTHAREFLFGEIVDGQMVVNRFGELAENAWIDLPNHYPHLELDRYVVMPNHFHGVIVLVGAGLKPAPTNPPPTTDKRHGLPEIVRAFKTFSARHINETRNSPGVPVWQRNYHEHIIRNEADFSRIAEYVATNPQRWIEDKLHPDNFVAGGNVFNKANIGDDGNICCSNNDGDGNIGGNANIVGAGLKPAPTDAAQPGGRDE
jgi:REP element-mobilizing transposase RayT